jgi:hypothetical protein
MCYSIQGLVFLKKKFVKKVLDSFKKPLKGLGMVSSIKCSRWRHDIHQNDIQHETIIRMTQNRTEKQTAALSRPENALFC